MKTLDDLLELLLDLTDEHCNGSKWMCDTCPLRNSEDCMATIIEMAKKLEWRKE